MKILYASEATGGWFPVEVVKVQTFCTFDVDLVGLPCMPHGYMCVLACGWVSTHVVKWKAMYILCRYQNVKRMLHLLCIVLCIVLYMYVLMELSISIQGQYVRLTTYKVGIQGWRTRVWLLVGWLTGPAVVVSSKHFCFPPWAHPAAKWLHLCTPPTVYLALASASQGPLTVSQPS